MKSGEMIRLLKKKGYSKNQIAILLKVPWASVNFWDRDIFQPNKEHMLGLLKLLRKNIFDINERRFDENNTYRR